jgi:Zn-dependent protease with chaperone function
MFCAFLLLIILVTFWVAHYALHSDESKRKSMWLAYRRQLHIAVLCALAGWWAFWDSETSSSATRGLNSFPAKPLLFWVLPAAGIAVVYCICYVLDRTVLERRWSVGDVIRLTCWRTVTPSVALLFAIAGFEVLYEKSFSGILWLLAAAIIAVVGTIQLRTAEGLRWKRVKSGDLYKRAFVMAREMGTDLKRVFVVPAGRGHLTNAYSFGQGIAVTDNYGKFLSRPQLDSVIGHELAHVKEGHGRKNRRIALIVYTSTALAVFFLPRRLTPWRSLLDLLVIFVPMLICYSVSRRFEYAADRVSVEFTKDPEAAIHALVNLYRMAEAPTHCDCLTELFMTHPALTRRVWAIGRAGGMPAERISEIVAELEHDKCSTRSFS